jgi:putative transposase
VPRVPDGLTIAQSRSEPAGHRGTTAYMPDNGVCEAFVKTFKRDYMRVNPRPDAISVLQQLPAWFEDYNAIHPHSGLRMLSPREFVAQQSSTPAVCPV